MVHIETLNEYLLKNNIIVKEGYFKSLKPINNKEIFNQIELMSDVDSILTSYSLIGYTRLYSVIGKRVENFKVQLRKLDIDLKSREKKEVVNETDIFICNKGNEILQRGWEVLGFLKDIDYCSIINRSMALNEICLGKTDESNLRKNDAVEIGKLKNAGYNLIEEDIYVYLKKLKLRNKEMKVEHYIDKFVQINNLNGDSKEYIKILLLFPSATIKQWSKYKENKKNLSPEEHLSSIKKAFEYEI